MDHRVAQDVERPADMAGRDRHVVDDARVARLARERAAERLDLFMTVLALAGGGLFVRQVGQGHATPRSLRVCRGCRRRSRPGRRRADGSGSPGRGPSSCWEACGPDGAPRRPAGPGSERQGRAERGKRDAFGSDPPAMMGRVLKLYRIRAQKRTPAGLRRAAFVVCRGGRLAAVPVRRTRSSGPRARRWWPVFPSARRPVGIRRLPLRSVRKPSADRGVVDEELVSRILPNEPVTLGLAEPLD